MASLQPACHTPKFSNDYYLCVTTLYDACTCCAAVPNARMSMTIAPLVNPDCIALSPPEGFSPVELGYIEFDLDRVPDSHD